MTTFADAVFISCPSLLLADYHKASRPSSLSFSTDFHLFSAKFGQEMLGIKLSASDRKAILRVVGGPQLAAQTLILGLRKATRESIPGSWVQRCRVHSMRNILCKLPEKARPGLKKLIQASFGLDQLQVI
jgi:hypothetical protein